MTRKVIFFFLLLISLSLMAFIFKPKPSQVEIVSDVPSFSLKKDNIEKFSEILREWAVFNEKNFFLHSLNQFVSPRKIVFHLTDKQQAYQFFYDFNTDKVIMSVGEEWDDNEKVLNLSFYIDPIILEKGEISIVSKNFNSLILRVLYYRTHKGDKNLIEAANKYIDYFTNEDKFPFVLEKK